MGFEILQGRFAMGMLINFPQDLLNHWELWLIPIAGLLATLGALFVGRKVLLSRKQEEVVEASADDPFHIKKTRERRTTNRRAGNPVGILITDENTSAPPFQGIVLDRSQGGLRIQADRPVEVGKILNVLPALAPKTTPWIPVEVRSCTPDGAGFELRCQFLQTPPWGTILLFG